VSLRDYCPAGGVPFGTLTDTHSGCVHSSRIGMALLSRNASGRAPGPLRSSAGSRFSGGLSRTGVYHTTRPDRFALAILARLGPTRSRT